MGCCCHASEPKRPRISSMNLLPEEKLCHRIRLQGLRQVVRYLDDSGSSHPDENYVLSLLNCIGNVLDAFTSTCKAA